MKHLIAIVAFVFVRGLLHQSFGASDLPDDKFFRSFVKTHCVDCHGPEKQKGDVRFDKLADNPAADADLWLSVLEQLEAGEMPPKKKPQPSEKELLEVLEWIDVNVSSARRAFQTKMQHPENGNLVSHDELFDPKVAEKAPKIAASPARVWRTLPQSYEQKQEVWPVDMVSYLDAKAFCEKASKNTDARFRLPTEAEWEYAYRAGTRTKFYNGDDNDKSGEIGQCTDNNFVSTTRVGTKRPNAFGLFDMAGNVREHCSDYWDSSYEPVKATDPQGPKSGLARAQRGGGWDTYCRTCNATSRSGSTESYAGSQTGFRLTRVP